MGLLDILNGMQNGPRGQRDPSQSGGMSPLTMAILALLAYKAVKKIGGSGTTAAPAGNHPSSIPASIPASLPGQTGGGFGGGGLGDLLKGGLGGLLAGGAAGSILSGGLGDLLKQLQQGGQGEVANSWVAPGQNKPIGPNDLASALGADQIHTLMEHSGLSRDELLAGLAQQLPDVVDQLTPDGRLPTEDEVSRLI